MKKIRRELARGATRLRATRALDSSDLFALAGVALVAFGSSFWHASLPWLLIGLYLVRVSSAPARR